MSSTDYTPRPGSRDTQVVSAVGLGLLAGAAPQGVARVCCSARCPRVCKQVLESGRVVLLRCPDGLRHRSARESVFTGRTAGGAWIFIRRVEKMRVCVSTSQGNRTGPPAGGAASVCWREADGAHTLGHARSQPTLTSLERAWPSCCAVWGGDNGVRGSRVVLPLPLGPHLPLVWGVADGAGRNRGKRHTQAPDQRKVP